MPAAAGSVGFSTTVWLGDGRAIRPAAGVSDAPDIPIIPPPAMPISLLDESENSSSISPAFGSDTKSAPGNGDESAVASGDVFGSRYDTLASDEALFSGASELHPNCITHATVAAHSAVTAVIRD